MKQYLVRPGAKATTTLVTEFLPVTLAVFGFLMGSLLLVGCQPVQGPAQSGDDVSNPLVSGLVGDWRAVLASPGGELPFTLVLRQGAAGLEAVAMSAGDEAPFSGLTIAGDVVVLSVDWYDSEITATLVAPGRLVGEWRKTIDDGDSRLDFVADLGRAETRFETFEGTADTSILDVSGRWAMVFTDEDGDEPAMAELTQQGDEVTGTVLTPTGDYRYLEGSYQGGRLRLSTFDGAHAFLFDATANAQGELEGGFWSRDTYSASFSARPMSEDEPTPLPDPFSEVGLTNDDGRFGFSFPDLEGNQVSSADDRFAGKVLLVDVFGSWCPNCNDSAPVLADLDRRYRDRGLEVVGLAYEMREDQERNRALVRRFAERHGIEYQLLLAGTSTDKAEAGVTLPDLTAVLSYPTKIFIDRTGRVRRIHSGFSGPGTGAHYQRLVRELDETVQELLDEPNVSG